jgi:VWFA-related protein
MSSRGNIMDTGTRNLLAAAILMIAALASAVAQMLQAPTALAQEGDSPQGTLVKVWITAVDDRGRPVLDLKKDDLKLYEDKVERQILGLTAKDPERLTVGLLIDASVKPRSPYFRPKLTGSSELLRPILKAGGQGFVALFGNSLSEGVLTSDAWTLQDSVHRAEGVWLGRRAALFDSIVAVCQNKFPDGRKALVVVSDGNDTARKSHLADAVRSAELTRTQVFFLFTLILWNQMVQEHETWMRDARLAADRLTSTTGGKFYQVATDADVDRTFKEIAEYLTSEYALTFYSAGPGPHKISFKILRLGVRILSQHDYPASQN